MAYNIVSFVFILNVIRTSAYNENVTNLTVSDMMAVANVVPDVIPVPPRQFLRISYPPDILVNLGNELTPRQVKDQPIVKWIPIPDTFYTLIMIDADFRSHKKSSLSQWLHWLVVNIPGLEIRKGETISEYVGAFPQKGTGLHRYVFVLFSQLRRMKFLEPELHNNSLDGRAGFIVNEFAERYYMRFPDAGNFFKAQWDEYVPELYKSLGI